MDTSKYSHGARNLICLVGYPPTCFYTQKRQIVVGPRGITPPQMFGNSEILVREGNRVGDHPKSMGATIMLTNVVAQGTSI